MTPLPHTIQNNQPDYEKSASLIRLLVTAAIVLTFPPQDSRALLIYGLATLAFIYIAIHHRIATHHQAWISSPASLLIDTLVLSGFLYLSGGLETAYSMLYFPIIIAAIHQKGLKRSAAIIALQGLILVVIASQDRVPLQLNFARTILILLATLSVSALFLSKLKGNEYGMRQAITTLDAQRKAGEATLLALMNSLPEAVFLIDKNGKILRHNANAEALLQTSKIKHQDLNKLLPLKDPQGGVLKLRDLAHKEHQVTRNDLSLASAEFEMALALSIAPSYEEGPNTEVSYIVICSDITKAKTLDQERKEFIAVTSHELRTPLAITEAALSTALLAEKQWAPAVATVINQAYRNVLFLSALVADLGVLAQAQNDNIPIKLEPMEPKALFKQLIKDYQAEAKEKELAIITEIKPNTPTILTTEHYVREVLQNYMINAIKYSPKGTITLRCEPSTAGGVLFSVEDTGIGISPSDQKHLFSKFFRSEDFRTRETGGTGLGLYLCSELAQRLDAKVWCQSKLNHGSTFFLELPPYSQLKRDRGEVVEAKMSALTEEL